MPETMDTCCRYLRLWMYQYKTYVNSVDGRDPPHCIIDEGIAHQSSIVFDCFSNNNQTRFTIVFHIQTLETNSIHQVEEGMIFTNDQGEMRQVLKIEVNSNGNQYMNYWAFFAKRDVIEALHPRLVARGFVTNPLGTQAAVDAICRYPNM